MRLVHLKYGMVLAVALMAAGCTLEMEGGEGEQPSSLSLWLDMEPMQEEGTRAAYGPVLLSDGSDWKLFLQAESRPMAVESEPLAETRASAATLAGISSVKVTAYDHTGNFDSSTTNSGLKGFANTTFSVTSYVGAPSPDKYWPFVNRRLSFFAYANEGSGMGASPIAHTTGYPSFTYTIPAVASQTDLLVTESLDQVASVVTDGQPGRVPLTFHHALCAVVFSIGSSMGLEGSTDLKITLSGLNNSGTFTYSSVSPTYGAWSGLSGTASYEITGTPTHSTDISTMAGDKVLFLLPQTIPAGANLTLEYTDPAGVKHTYSKALTDLGITGWTPGNYYQYTVGLDNRTLKVGAYPSWKDAGNNSNVNGPVMAYTNGEIFGVFAVDGSTNKVVWANVSMTIDGSGNLSDGGSHLIDHRYTYYVYYPYRASLSGAPVAGADFNPAGTADSFFTNVFSGSTSIVSGWTVSDDQSDLAKFKAQDLQVGKATFSGSALTATATLAHKMGLAKITPTAKNVTTTLTWDFTANSNTHTAYTETKSGTTSITASSAVSEIPRLYSSGGIWTIVKATGDAASTAVTVTSNPGVADYWSQPISGIGYGKYKNHNVTSSRSYKNFVANFPYNTTKTYYQITLPSHGPFKLEAWGASGTTNFGDAGLGGYTYGTYTSTVNSKVLYVCVGGAGGHNATNDAYGTYGGYNGGGHGQAGGGGATHFADALVGAGTLSAYSSTTNQGSVLIVAGGAGNANLGIGGHGGGGNSNGTHGMKRTRYATMNAHPEQLWLTGYYGGGGTLTAGGSGTEAGGFGTGGNANTGNDSAAGGGGGWFGGGSSSVNARGSGGGGSGHIHSTKITNGGGQTGRTSSDCANGATNMTGGVVTLTTAPNPAPTTYGDSQLEYVITPTGNLQARGSNGYAKITLQ